jgi:iron complex transport system ATP-binding protein
MSQTAIEIKNLSFGYEKKEILHEINLQVRAGDYVALIGPNGVGKSTLLKCINRIVRASSASIRLFDKDLADYSQRELGKLIGYVPQYLEQLFSYTVFEFVLMARYPYFDAFRPASLKDEDKVQEILALLKLSEFKERRMNKISGGERQKVYIAAALAQEPKILLLDEPTAHLDPKYHAEIQRLISQVAQNLGLTVLHVTHDLNHIFSWSQDVVAMKNGRIVCQGNPSQVLTDKNLESIFETKFIIMSHPQTKKNIIVPEMS